MHVHINYVVVYYPTYKIENKRTRKAYRLIILYKKASIGLDSVTKECWWRLKL